MRAENSEITRERIIALIEGEFESDAAFERELGLAPKTVNNWRRGRSKSYMNMLPRLAESFDVNVGELLDIPIQKDTSELSDDEIELLSLYRKSSILSAKQRLSLSKTIESVINLYIDSAAEKAQKSGRRK